MRADCLLVTPYYDPNIVGGAEISTQLIAEGLSGRCDVLTFGRVNAERQVNGVRVREICLPELADLWANPLDGTTLTIGDKISGHLRAHRPTRGHAAFYRDTVREGGYRTVVMNANEAAMDRPSLWKGAHDGGAHVVLALRDDSLLHQNIGPLHYDNAYRGLIQNQLDWVDALVAPSRYMLGLYAGAGLAKHDSRVIPNAVHLGDGPEPVAFGEKSGVIFAGSIGKHKGIPSLLEASRSFVGDRCTELVGRGPLVDECRAAGCDVRDWMSQDELHGEMARAKVLVLPSVWPEAFGRVLVEAVLCGTLAVGSRAGGIPEVLSHDDRYLFPANDAEALAACVNRVLGLSEEEYAKELTEMRARMAKFSVDQYVAAWRDVLDGVSA
ncbi:glycosyltransferase [Paratractidigestivibacter sp.]|uniref:glycosyltransferase n=1 Tax=Paratractidigestivibacter sp. TaxID=2847316 RepID=UPI002ACB1338|nr:glycosyltransferase [Paratractidigestivibacter sp.]